MAGVDVGQLVGGAFGGAIATSVLGPLIAQRHERRDLRGGVLRAILDVERGRWAPAASRDEFLALVISMRSAALVAAVPRELVDNYARLAQISQRVSEEDLNQSGGDEEFGGGIPGDLGKLTRNAAQMLIDAIWHPYRSRASTRWRLRKMRAAEKALRSDRHQRVPWDTPVY